MSASTTVTIKLDSELQEKLGQLANASRRSKSFLASEAVSAFVERELAIVEGIQQGLTDVEIGRIVPHDEAMAEICATIETT